MVKFVIRVVFVAFDKKDRDEFYILKLVQSPGYPGRWGWSGNMALPISRTVDEMYISRARNGLGFHPGP